MKSDADPTRAGDLPRAEPAHASPARLAAILEATTDLVAMVDAGGRLLYLNHSGREMLQIGPDEDVSRTSLRDFLTAGGRATLCEEAVPRAVRDGAWSGETTLLGRAGREAAVGLTIIAQRDGDGGVEFLSAVARDVTEARRAEEERKGLLKEYRMMFDSVPALIWYKDRDNRILRVNRPAAESMGRAVADLEGRSTYDLYPDEAEKYHRDDLEVVRSGRPKLGIVEQVVTGTGEKLWVQTDKVPYRDERGDVVGVIVFSVDVSDRHRAQQEVRQLNAELEQRVRDRTAQLEAANARLQAEIAERARAEAELARSNAELEQFAYVASHDLQEPLRKVQAFGDMLSGECGPALSADGRDYLGRMQKAAGRMQLLIDDLLSFSRVNSQTRPFVPVDLSRVAREVVSDLEARARETGGRVEVGDLPTLEADPTQMRQLLQNLIGNALKFRRPDEAPVVTVSGRLLEDAGDGGNGLRPGPSCEIVVRDAGIGFDEKYLDRIFAPFQRLHGRGQYEGTGIGLAICRKIAERHGGTITARSAPGRGAAFIVRLPLRRPGGGARHE